MISVKHHASENKDWLTQHGFMKDLGSNECKTFVDLVETHRAMDGEYLFEEGEQDDEIFIIRKGKVALGYRSPRRDIVNWGTFGNVDFEDNVNSDPCWNKQITLGVGECFGEPDIAKDTPHQMSARAIGEVEILRLAAKPLRERMKNDSSVCRCLGEALCASVEKLLSKR
ncbi:MAG: cyclic nucleotide-binding domain-containing protein [Magnetococcales bacterium]|nr:cyclic nucleotide-binding domain-containing protein [Magnetococcales bacterium]